MENLTKDYQLVIIDSPYEVWSEPLVQTLFGKMVNLKKAGYGANYPFGVLPVDTTDFIASHVLLCEKDSGNNLEPVMGYKTITLQKCRDYNLNFPGLSLVQNAKMPEHCQVVEQIIQRCEAENKILSYLGSWTVNPNWKHRQNKKKELKEAFMAFYQLVYEEQNVSEVIIGGTLRFGTEKLFYNLGHRPLAKNGEPLSHIHVAHLAKESVLVMHSNSFKGCPEVGQKWKNLWSHRIHFDSHQQQNLKQVA